jgi:Fe-Mn family superoxide dismutase
MTFSLPELPYAHDALAPYMSKETLEFHHDKHHKAYVDNGNKLLEGSGLEGKSLEEIVKGAFGKNAGLFNNAGQHYNHLHFWKWMKPKGGGKIPGELEKKIIADLGSVEKMKEDFIQAGVTQFGSGWAWLTVKDGKIAVTKTANGESPLVHGGTPILGCDVWEHSYYIDYRNRRPDYLKAWPKCSRRRSKRPFHRSNAVALGRRRFYFAKAERMRAQLRAPLRKDSRSYFSFGEWMRSSSSPKPTRSESMPRSCLKEPTIGIEPPEPFSTAGRPNSASSAARVFAR